MTWSSRLTKTAIGSLGEGQAERNWTGIRGSGIWFGAPVEFLASFWESVLTCDQKEWKNIFEEQLPGSPYQAFKDAFSTYIPGPAPIPFEIY